MNTCHQSYWLRISVVTRLLVSFSKSEPPRYNNSPSENVTVKFSVQKENLPTCSYTESNKR